MPRAVFPRPLLALLAVAEFCELSTPADRAAWAQARGVEGPLSDLLVTTAKQMHQRRIENAKLGLPDPLR